MSTTEITQCPKCGGLLAAGGTFTGKPCECSFAAPTGYASGLTVTVAQHPKGCIVRVEHEGAVIYLDADEAFELYHQLRGKLSEIPVKL